MLPYSFAKRFGVVVTGADAAGVQVALRSGDDPRVLAEVRRVTGRPLAITTVEPARFDRLLSDTYALEGFTAGASIAGGDELGEHGPREGAGVREGRDGLPRTPGGHAREAGGRLCRDAIQGDPAGEAGGEAISLPAGCKPALTGENRPQLAATVAVLAAAAVGRVAWTASHSVRISARRLSQAVSSKDCVSGRRRFSKL
ncbi:MAG: hypothetical protein H7067_05040 [Burkholderiales bacterium]|nr:hypothetical protein [Opitutaceae bacterium]